MEMWELFLKGLAKTFEDFAVKMIEKGKELDAQEKGKGFSSPVTREETGHAQKPKPRKRTIPHRDLGILETQILDIVGRHPDGITLKEVAAELDVQWHYLRIPFRQLTLEGKLIKEEKLYKVSKTRPAAGNASADTGNQDADKSADSTAPEKSGDTEQAKSQPRRRVVNAKELERREQNESVISTLSIRDRERLRYRILTALRGRPEGLNLEKLSAVLGMDLALLTPILQQLQGENKVVQVDNEKFRLP